MFDRNRNYQSMQSLGLMWSVFDTGLIATPLMGYLGYLASHWSVPVHSPAHCCCYISFVVLPLIFE